MPTHVRAQANSTVLIVEDEISIAEALVFALRNEGYQCTHYATGGACLDALRDCRGEALPALILLDVGLPDGSGFDWFRCIREICAVPIIFLTARREEVDRVVGLEMGADDYVVKPFSVRELMARVRMVMRRHVGGTPTTGTSTSDPTLCAGFTHDRERREIRYRNTPLSLTLHEYGLLLALLRHPSRVLTRAQLLQQAWDAPDHRLERTIDSHVKSLRAKLRAVDPGADPIRTHRGVGYSLELIG